MKKLSILFFTVAVVSSSLSAIAAKPHCTTDNGRTYCCTGAGDWQVCGYLK